MRTIGLIELYAHSEVLRTYLRVLTKAGYELRLFCSIPVHTDLKEDAAFQSSSCQLMKAGEACPTFFERCRPQLEKCDLLIFTTIASDFRYFAQLQNLPKTLLVIHNGYSFFAPLQHLHLTKLPIDVLRLGKQLLFRELYYKRALLQNMDYISFPTLTIQQYLEQEGLLKSISLAPPLSFGLYEGLPERKEEDFVNIVIPGTISNEGRDYRLLFEAVRRALPALERKLRVVLLGRPKGQYGRAVIKDFKALEGEQFQLQSYSALIPQAEFDHQLQQADFLILPLKKFLQCSIFREIYGYTNISGGINDMIRFGLPALISGDYPLEEALEGMCQRYKDRDGLAQLITNWVNEEVYEKKREKVGQLLSEYTLEVMSNKFKQHLDQL